jgi:hypothetical protein
MTTNADAIAALVKSKATLQAQCDDASGDTLAQLVSTIHNITSEIGALETAALNDANYIPATDPFKSATADAQSFLATINNLKTAFADVGVVASALDTVVNLVTKLGL